MNIISEIENAIKEAKNSGEYGEKVPQTMLKFDVELNRIIEEYAKLTKAESKAVRDRISTKTAWWLLGFAQTMATYSLRLSEQKLFTNGLMALGMVLDALDRREVLLIIHLFTDVSKRTGLSFEPILSRNDFYAAYLSDYIKGGGQNRTIEDMGYILSKDNDGNLFYLRTW